MFWILYPKIFLLNKLSPVRGNSQKRKKEKKKNKSIWCTLELSKDKNNLKGLWVNYINLPWSNKLFTASKIVINSNNIYIYIIKNHILLIFVLTLSSLITIPNNIVTK